MVLTNATCDRTFSVTFFGNFIGERKGINWLHRSISRHHWLWRALASHENCTRILPSILVRRTAYFGGRDCIIFRTSNDREASTSNPTRPTVSSKRRVFYDGALHSFNAPRSDLRRSRSRCPSGIYNAGMGSAGSILFSRRTTL